MKHVHRNDYPLGENRVKPSFLLPAAATMKPIVSILLPSFGTIVFLGVFLGLVCLGNTNTLLGDTDTGYHIKAGEIILETFSVPRYDIFSFHSPSLPWTAHEWLSEVIMALVHRAFGLTGIVVFFAFIIALTYYLLFKILRISGSNIILTIALVALVIASSTLHWLARPHVFSWIFILIYQYLLDTYQHRNRNYLYVLPLLMLVWVNLHGGFIVGFMLIGIYLAGNVVRIPSLTNSERSVFKGKALALFLTLAGCLLTSIVNPYGYHILLFPVRLMSEKFLMDYIIEYWSPNFHAILPFRYLLYLTIAILAFSVAKLDFIELALVLLFTHMALYSGRHIPLFAIVVSPILLKYAGLLLDETHGKAVAHFKTKSQGIALIDSSAAGYLWTVGAATVVCLLLLTAKIHFQFDEKANPVAAIEFLKQENLKGNMFNNDTFGDYVIYAAWPQYHVFVDGRFDMYGSSLMQEYDKVWRPTAEWKNILNKYHINWIFDGAKSPLSTLLLESPDWRLVYADSVANIFVKNIPGNHEMIRRFANVKPISANGASHSRTDAALSAP